jgi:hypothetical protein
MKATVAAPALATCVNAAQIGLVLLMPNLQVTQGKCSSCRCRMQFLSRFAVHFANVNTA